MMICKTHTGKKNNNFASHCYDSVMRCLYTLNCRDTHVNKRPLFDPASTPSLTPLFRNPLSIRALRKVGHFRAFSQSERMSAKGAESLLRSRKTPGCRFKAFLYRSVDRHLFDPSTWLARERKLPIRWTCGRRADAIRSVVIYIWAGVISALHCLAWNIWMRGHLRFKTQRIMSDFLNFPLKPNLACLLFLLVRL